MLLFLQYLKSLAFSLETLLSIVLGVILGIFLGLPYYIGLFVLLGWMLIPLSLAQYFSGHDVITHSTGGGGFPNPAWVGWVNWGIIFFYILFLCCYGWYAYRATRCTGSLQDGMRSTLWSALVMILSAIIPSTLTMLWSQRSPFSTVPFYFGEALLLCFLFAIPLAVMALLAGFAGSLLGKRRRTFRNLPTVGFKGATALFGGMGSPHLSLLVYRRRRHTRTFEKTFGD